MDITSAVAQRAGGTARGIVTALLGDGLVSIECGDDELVCQVLQSSDRALTLHPGDEVLLLPPRLEEDVGIVLGRLGEANAPEAAADSLPDEVVIEAGKGLTLRVGEGSITIREDGRILIKGKDLVSHARGLNRIRGGAVAIN
jgi:hypothetical protein